MNNDDSFNDCDEEFNLYSSKNVTDTFKAQLRKIVESNHHLTKVSEVNSTEENAKKEENGCAQFELLQKTEENHPSPDNSVNVIDKILDTTVDVDSAEDSLEIIGEFIPRKKTRQSERLKKKRGRINGDLHTTSSNQDLSDNVSSRTRKKRIKRKNQLEKKSTDPVTLDNSPGSYETEEELNPIMSIKVIWKSVNIKKFQIRKFQKLSYIYEQLSKEENIPDDQIILTFNNTRVTPNDTPDSLNLQVYHFLDGGVVNESTNLNHEPNLMNNEPKKNLVTLKFQDINKRIILVNLNPDEKLKVGMIKCSEQLEIPLEKIKFFCDGELLNSTETPTSLGLEDEDIIDIKIL